MVTVTDTGTVYPHRHAVQAVPEATGPLRAEVLGSNTVFVVPDKTLSVAALLVTEPQSSDTTHTMLAALSAAGTAFSISVLLSAPTLAPFFVHW